MTDGDGLTSDAFLGGRLKVLQPASGYRAGADPVMMAAFVPARPGDSVLELGLGVGVASLCLAARVPGLDLTGIEIDPATAELARRNAASNGVGLRVVAGDVAALPDDLRAMAFDQVMLNPPYFGEGPEAQDAARAAARHETTPLPVWIDAALRRLRPNGWLTLVIAADRLPEVLAAATGRLGSIEVLPIAARSGRPAGRILLRGRKGGRAPFTLRAPLVMHDGDRHDGDRDSHSALARSVLRDGAAIA